MQADTKTNESKLKEKFTVENTPILRDLINTPNTRKETFITKTNSKDIILAEGDVITTPTVQGPKYDVVVATQESTGIVIYSLDNNKYRFYPAEDLQTDYEKHDLQLITDPWKVNTEQTIEETNSLKSQLLAEYNRTDLPVIGQSVSNNQPGITINESDDEIKPGDVIYLRDEFRFILNVEEDRKTFNHPEDRGIIYYNLDRDYITFYPMDYLKTDYESDRINIISDPWKLQDRQTTEINAPQQNTTKTKSK